jgi:hypothetical protein
MTKRLALVAVGLLALAAAGLAIAKIVQTSSVTAVSATFTATTQTGKSVTRTCTTADGKTLVATHATFTGSAASASPELAGPLTVDTQSLVNTTDDVGRVDARLRVASSSGKTDLHVTGVYDHGNLAGLATGHAATPHVQLVGNLSSSFSTGGGFTNGKIGGGSAGGSAIELGPGRCAPTKPAPKPSPPTKPAPKPSPPHPEQVQATGTISAVSATSITVAGLTCTVPSNLAARVSGLKTGDRAGIRCIVSNGANTLTKVDKKH